MVVNTFVKYVEGKAYLVRASSDLKERFGLSEEKEVPLPILLYLVYTGVAEIVNEKGERIGFRDLVKSLKNANTFSMFIVLYDLVKRGRKVGVGEIHNELVIIDEKIKIYVLDEDSYIVAEELYKIVDRAIKQGYRLVVAVVDINGEVTYYEVNKTDFPRIERR
ncbi:MAG: hypothetical protein QW101_02275 [Ignisphaera sp.]|uniref:Uncharacterized protein n=1 Tax=Ignisphaera aggregans TaxID=334771 RepID=A0A7J3MXX1_9CREN